MATDPNNAQRLLACSIIGPTSDARTSTGAYSSFDGGASWGPVATEDKQRQNFDPACTYGINNDVYFASLSRGKDFVAHLNAYYSGDGGRSWIESNIPAAARYYVDREYITVDMSNSKYRGRIYMHAFGTGFRLGSVTRLSGFTLYRSLDRGKTFGLPIERLLPDLSTTIHNGNSVILSDGTFVAVFAQLTLDRRNDGYPTGDPTPASRPNGLLKVITSSNGGESLDQEVQISDFYGDWRTHTSGAPSLAADVQSSVFRDRLYAVWSDGRFGRRTQVVLSYSSDNGRTWSKPRLVSDDRAPALGTLERPVALPVVAVNKEGIVGVLWLDRRESPNDVDYHVRFAASLDGGETFLHSVRVSEQSEVSDQREQWLVKAVTQTSKGNPARLILVREAALRPGDTAGLAADANGVFHALWIDNRTGIRQVWTASITVKGQFVKNGDESAAQLDDVTSKIDLDVVEASFDRARGEGTLNIRLKNVSKDTIVGPIKLRALIVTSELGVAHILNADNGLTSDGAMWDYSSLLENNMLPPGGTSGVKALRFRITDLKPFRQPNGSYKWIFADVNAIVLGTVQVTQAMRTK
jgi:hypothetical protein